MLGLAERIVLLDGWRRALLALAAGAVAALGLAPLDVFAAGFVAFPVLVLLLDGAAGTPGASFLRRLGPAFRIGWFFGFGYFVAGLWWLGAAMTNDGDAFLWAIPFAVLALPAILAIYFGCAAALARAVWSDGTGRILALAGSFALFETLRGRLFTGFPWNEIGTLIAPVPLMMQSIGLAGLHGLTLVAVIVFSAPALLFDRGSRRFGLGLAVFLAAGHLGYGAYALARAESGFVEGVRLRLVQPNILQSQKWDAAEETRIFDRLITLTGMRPEPAPLAPSDAVPPDPAAKTLVFWPESAFPFLLTERPDAIVRLGETLLPGETLIAGAARQEEVPGEAPRYYNSVYVIDEAGEILDARDKVHLVPFGEYLPFETVLKRLGLTQLVHMPGGFSAGAVRTPVALAGVPAFLSLICYEIIFGDEIRQKDAPRAGFVVNLTNDAWYGATPGPYQHMRQAQLSSVALGLPLVRSANTGISFVSDAAGRVIDGLALGSAGTVETQLPRAGAETPFSRYGGIPFWAAFAVTWLAACVYRVRDARLD